MQVNAPDEKAIASEWLKGLASKQEAWKDALVERQRPRYQPRFPHFESLNEISSQRNFKI
jgi:hypothetical protein